MKVEDKGETHDKGEGKGGERGRSGRKKGLQSRDVGDLRQTDRQTDTHTHTHTGGSSELF